MLVIRLLNFVFTVALGCDVTIHTTDQGLVDSRSPIDFYNYYTNLASHSILPSEEKYMIFSVKTCHDAFILLSGSSDLRSSDFYEIVLGSARNTQVRIRKSSGKDHNKPKFNGAVLKCSEFIRITITWSDNGEITIGSDSESFIAWTDPSPIQIRGFGAMTAWGSSGEWIFRTNDPCPCSCDYQAEVEYWSSLNITNLSRGELLDLLKPKLDKIKQDLTVYKGNLSSSLRKRNSASDSRKSSEQIGIVGVLFLCVVTLLVVLIDLIGNKRNVGRKR